MQRKMSDEMLKPLAAGFDYHFSFAYLRAWFK